MKKRLVKLALLSAVLFAASPASAQSVDDKIKSLEQELMQLKTQQVELKKEATAAAAALPTFEYRPGNGLNIEAADKSWGVRFTVESHFRMNFESGRDQVGRTQGELMGRRFRPGIIYCVNNCLWEIEATLDLDGWGTGTGKNATGDDFGSILQRGAVNFHMEESASLAADGAVRHGSAKRPGRKLGATGFRVGRLAGGVRSSHPQQRVQHRTSGTRHRAQLG